MNDQNFCELVIANSGLPDCDPKLGKPIALYFTNEGFEITPQEQNDLLAFFQQRAQAADYSDRVIPVTGMKQLDDGYTAPTTGTLAGYGYSEQLGDGVLISTFHYPMALCRAKSIYSLNGFTGRAFVLLDNGIMMATRLSNGNLKGLPVESLGAQVVGGLFGDGANIKTVQLVVTFGSDTQVVKSMTAVKYDFNVNDVKGLQNLTLSRVDELNYQVLVDCGGANLYDAYMDELKQPQAWNVRKLSDSTTVQVVTVTEMEDTKSFKLTLADNTSRYKVSVRLAAIDALMELGIEGFENVKAVTDQFTEVST